MRTCGGALKGLPLRELVETFFESIACRPSVGSGDRSEGASGPGKNNGGVTGAAGGGIPNVELTALAVMHLPDLLQCFSEVCVRVFTEKSVEYDVRYFCLCSLRIRLVCL